MMRVAFWLLFWLLPFSVQAQQDSSTPQLRPRSAVPQKIPPPGGTDRQITLDVQVTDHSGAPIRGLQQQDFTLLDDKHPVSIVSFRAMDGSQDSTTEPPVEVVLVVDAVNTSFLNVADERNQIKTFLLRNDGHLAQPVSMVVFSTQGTNIQTGSSRDGKELAALYDQYEIGLRTITRSQGFYGAAERYQLSLKTLSSLIEHETLQPGRKLMIWLSAGWPLLSGPEIQLSRENQSQLFQSIVEISSELRQSRVTLYSIDASGLADAGGPRTFYYKEFLKGVTSPSRVLPGNLGLQVIAEQSGGKVVTSTNDLAGAIEQCAADAGSFYVLSFNAAPAEQANEYHSLTVKIDRSGSTARTRAGYYAQPE